MFEACTDHRFKIINAAKQDLLESTNIDTSPKEMEVLDNFLFRCWQMGWLDKYVKKDVPDTNVGKWIPCSERLPEENQIVMCSVKKEYAFHRIVVQRFDNRDYWHNGIVEAWMPLPEPYKAGDT